MDARNHYWVVGGSTSQVYSSKTNTYVAPDDADLVAWIEAGNSPSRIAVEEELWVVLQQRVPGYLPDWLNNGMTFSQPTTGSYTQAQLVAYAAMKRYEKEQGGMTIGGVPILTDDRSKMLIIGSRMAADADASWTTVWAGADGNDYRPPSRRICSISRTVWTM